MRPSVDGVFFDLYGTLLDLSGLAGTCEAAAPGLGAELAARWRARQLEATWLRTAMGRWADFETVTSDALAVAAEELGLDGAALSGSLDGAWLGLTTRDGVLDLLDRLDAAAITTGVLSNGSGSMIRRSLEGAGLDGRFGHLLSADAVRRFKPAPELYALAVEATGRPAGRIGFVTANGWDAAGAATAGFTVAWLKPAGASLPAVGPLERPPKAVTVEEVAALFHA